MDNVNLEKTGTELIRVDWFKYLVEQVDAIVTQARYQASEILVRAYHEAGACILANEELFKAQGIGTDEAVQLVARSMGKGKRTLQYARKFAERFPDIDLYLEQKGNDLSWKGVIIDDLTDSHKPEIGVPTRFDDPEFPIEVEQPKIVTVEQVRQRMMHEIKLLHKNDNMVCQYARRLLQQMYDDLFGFDGGDV